MSVSHTKLLALAVLALLPVAGCSSDPICWGTAYTCLMGERCTTNAQCASGLCEMSACLETCEGHTCPAGATADDPDQQCLVTATGRGCRDTCTTAAAGPTVPDGAMLVCDESGESGVPIACADASDELLASWCANCGCPTAGDHCIDDGPGESSCVTPVAVGSPCTRHEDCVSEHCSPYTNTCRTAVGEVCTNATCDFCLLTEGVYNCYQSCDDGVPCDPGSVCLSGGAGGRFYCHAVCTSDATVCPREFTCIDATGMAGVRVCHFG